MKKKIKANTELESNTLKINSEVANFHGLEEGGTDKLPAHISLKYFDSGYQCFSELDKNQLEAFSELNNKLRQMNWVQIKQSASKKNKTGLALTKLERYILPNRQSIKKISEDISFMELRLTGESRVVGFRSGSSFFMVFLDKDHDICA